MNSKQFLLLVALSCGVVGLSASEKDMTEEEIALAVKQENLKVGDSVSYKGDKYTLAQIDVTTNGDYYCIDAELSKPIIFFNKKFGERKIKIWARKGTEPFSPYQKIENEKGTRDTKNRIGEYSYNSYSDAYYALRENIKSIVAFYAFGSGLALTCLCGAKLLKS